MQIPSSLTVAAGFLLIALAANAQQRPYIGFAYPAGGKQGATVQVKLGGQALDDASEVLITGSGVTGRVIEYQRALNNQEFSLLNEQLRDLKRGKSRAGADMMSATMMSSGEMMTDAEKGKTGPRENAAGASKDLAGKIEKRVAEYVTRPASAALAHIAYLELVINPEAKPGQRELRLKTSRGISNPLFFQVGQLPEYSRAPMTTAAFQVLGKEKLALRKRPPEEMEQKIEIPCVLNGQIASGEINRYRFTARKGQKLVITTMARQLVPFIADAVPGWFQPVLRLADAAGKEVAYDDDYKFRPDPTILCEAPRDGEYVLDVYDAIYRGREDFVYRITVGEVPFVTGVFPLGAQASEPVALKVEGWNLGETNPIPLVEQDQPDMCRVMVVNAGIVSNPRAFELDPLPTVNEQEGNDTISKAQVVKLPGIINGRMDRKDDWDVFKISGKSNQVLVAEVRARRLDSSLDSVLKVTDATGQLLAFNDDQEDPFAGVNTHDADSYIRATLPSNGVFYVHIGDTARNWGSDCAYRLRLSSPQPDFALRLVPSSVTLRSKGSSAVTVHLTRKDGFSGPVKIELKDPPKGFQASPVSLAGTQMVARITIKTTLTGTEQPVDLVISGKASINGNEVTRVAVPAEDRMQAFFWRHLVPASSFQALVYDSSNQPSTKRVVPSLPEVPTNGTPALADNVTAKPKFTKQQVAGRLRQLKLLYEEGLLTDEFYLAKAAECQAGQ